MTIFPKDLVQTAAFCQSFGPNSWIPHTSCAENMWNTVVWKCLTSGSLPLCSVATGPLPFCSAHQWTFPWTFRNQKISIKRLQGKWKSNETAIGLWMALVLVPTKPLLSRVLLLLFRRYFLHPAGWYSSLPVYHFKIYNVIDTLSFCSCFHGTPTFCSVQHLPFETSWKKKTYDKD